MNAGRACFLGDSAAGAGSISTQQWWVSDLHMAGGIRQDLGIVLCGKDDQQGEIDRVVVDSK